MCSSLLGLWCMCLPLNNVRRGFVCAGFAGVGLWCQWGPRVELDKLKDTRRGWFWEHVPLGSSEQTGQLGVPSLQPSVPPDAHRCLEGCESTLCSWLLFKEQQQLSADRGCFVLVTALFPVSVSSTWNRFGCEHPDRTAWGRAASCRRGHPWESMGLGLEHSQHVEKAWCAPQKEHQIF